MDRALCPDEHHPLALALDPDLPEGTPGHALLLATMAQGFTREVARAGLRAELASWRLDDLAALRAELAAPEWHGRVPKTVLVLAARTLPASAMRQAFLARALGARVLLKSASGQEALGAALHLADPEIVPSPFPSHDAAALDAALAQADAVVVLGSDETVATVRARVTHQAFAGHGHKVSAAWLPSLEDRDIGELALGLAHDLLAWDQAGCLSPQALWVGPTAATRHTLLAELGAALAHLERELPLHPDQRLAQLDARRQMRTLATMLGERVLTTDTTTLATHPDPALRPAPGPRALWILPPSEAALAALGPHLSSLAVLPGTPLPAGLAPYADSVRLCAPGELQRPPLAWRQDGLHPLGSLLSR